MIDSDDLTPDYQTEVGEAETTEQGLLAIAEPGTESEIPKARKPKRLIDREVVIKLARLHCNTTEIARWFGVDANTINNKFRTDIELARGETRAKLRRKMLEEAMNGNTTMLIWLSKNMCGMSDNGPVDNEDKKPLPWTD